MDELLNDLLAAREITAGAKAMLGRSFGVYYGIVSDREDPLEMGRVKALVPSKAGSMATDWLTRGEPCPGLSLPVPQPGDTVAIQYKDGDPHQGYYSAVLQNNINPAWDKDSLRLAIGQVVIEISPDGTIALTGVESFYINEVDQQVLTLGATDNDDEGNGSDRVTGKGW